MGKLVITFNFTGFKTTQVRNVIFQAVNAIKRLVHSQKRMTSCKKFIILPIFLSCRHFVVNTIFSTFLEVSCVSWLGQLTVDCQHTQVLDGTTVEK